MIDRIISAIFSLPSLAAHLVISAIWFIFHLNLNLFTNLLSIEAILLSVMIGITQKVHHEAVKKHIKKEK